MDTGFQLNEDSYGGQWQENGREGPERIAKEHPL